jgi:uncharacterized OB-fold protein
MDLTRALDVTPSPQRPRIDYSSGRLIGSRCERCGSVSWPSRPVCHRCGSAATRELVLSPTGVLVTYTTVWVPRPGLSVPYILGQVDLADGVRVFAHGQGLGDHHHVPLPVRLVIHRDPEAVPPFVFEPEETA